MISGGLIPQVQSDAVYSLPRLYIDGLNIYSAAPTGATSIVVAPGAARDSTNTLDMVVGLQNYAGIDLPASQVQGYQPGLLVSSTVNGANGLDTGSIAANTQYAIYLIGDSRLYNPTAAVLSLTSNYPGPIMPKGYDSYRLIGFWVTDGSKHFVYSNVKPQNFKNALTYYNVPAISVLSGGNATSFTAIDLTTNSALPTSTLQNIVVNLLVVFTPNAAGDVVQFRPTGSSATGNLATITGVTAGVAQTQYIQVIAGVGAGKPEIDYLVTSSSDAVSVSVASWAGVSNTAYPALV